MTNNAAATGGVRRPSRSVLSDETHEAIRGMLLDHSIQPGEHINIDALARQLDVSQTPVREALARLESDGLVVKRALRGYSATELLTVDQIDDLFQFRALIEPWSAAQAAERHSDEDAAALSAEIETGRGTSKLELTEAYAAMAEHDERFHKLIARMSGSEFVEEAFIRTHCHLHLFRLYQAGQAEVRDSPDSEFVDTLFSAYYEPEGGFLAVREHAAIADAVLSGQANAASALMLDHIQSSRRRFSPTLNAIAS
ncbi:GntR family transcriptional regulator [Microbacterium sulfonylureivorans]|uniref:GntR family transcriptional regulator n=1 Tax=Microbacterium sulfonylureivorans TaxID=2486854 RepID=UPI000FDC8559|nr:GntR family transcriptional regulator [Microbacterium sulfonylureivorans]